MLVLIGAVYRNAQVVCLFGGELSEFDTDFFEVQTGDFFVELLR